MKKTLLLAVALLMLCTVILAACDGEGNESSAIESSTASTADKNDASKNDSDAESNASDDSGSVSDDSEVSDDESNDDNNDNNNDNNDDDNDDNSNDNSSAIPSEITTIPTEYVEGGLNIEACSYTEKPYFVIVGRCEDGATVTGLVNGKTYSSESYKGWYSLRLPCPSQNVGVELSQTVNGEQVGDTVAYNLKPATPGGDMWPVVAGGDFQFFFQKMLPDFQGTNLPSNLHLNNLAVRTKNKLSLLRENNPDAELIYLLVPSSMSVYSELVPDDYTPASGDTKYDLIVDKLTEGGATVIDLKGAFEEHKNDEMPLYYKLDSHWSDYGAFIAYTELFEHISKTFPKAAPRGEDEFNWNPGYYDSGDMSYYIARNVPEALKNQQTIKEYSYYRTFTGSVPASIFKIDRYVSESKLTYNDQMTYDNVINTGDSSLPNCIVFRDSYSTQIYDILAERMNRTHYYGMWNYTWDKASISSESPDYVIYIVAEWNLDAVLYN